MRDDDAVIQWLLGLDPALAWQTLRDLLDAPEPVWRAARARVATEGWGARLLALQDPDGQWAGGAFAPKDFTRADWQREGQPWTATSFVLTQLREFGLDAASPAARRTVAALAAHGRWEEGGQPFWHGETEECINGRLLADGAYFGVDMTPLADRLIGEVQPDGGWNCRRCDGSTRSSFASTINVLEGLLEHEIATGGAPACRAARRSGEAFLLERGLFRRLSTGAPADPAFVTLLYPHRWRYDILRALDYFRKAACHTGAPPDPRLADAVSILAAKRRDRGDWALDWQTPGRVWFPLDDGPGLASPWITLKALRVLRWWSATAVG